MDPFHPIRFIKNHPWWSLIFLFWTFNSNPLVFARNVLLFWICSLLVVLVDKFKNRVFKKEVPQLPVLNGRVLTKVLPSPVRGECGTNTILKSGSPETRQIGKIKFLTAQVIKDAANHTGIDEASTSNERRRALKDAYDAWEEVYTQIDNPRVKAALRQAQEELQYEYSSYDYRKLYYSH